MVEASGFSQKFKPGIRPPRSQGEAALWFAFCRDRLLVAEGDASLTIPRLQGLSQVNVSPLRSQYLGVYEGSSCYSAELAQDAKAPPGMSFQGLRQLFEALPEELFVLAGRAKQIMEWDRDHQFCGRCAGTMVAQAEDRSKKCPACGLTSFPRLAPAIIVAVTRGDEILLAHAARFASGWYSVLAGFVEPGETLEQAVEREVFEEVGVRVKDIRYFGSQPWPFPHSLMVGFTAQYAGGQLVLDPQEIKDARWFKADQLPNIPSKISIARRLIDHFVERVKEGADLEG